LKTYSVSLIPFNLSTKSSYSFYNPPIGKFFSYSKYSFQSFIFKYYKVIFEMLGRVTRQSVLGVSLSNNKKSKVPAHSSLLLKNESKPNYLFKVAAIDV
jgi:hypothetical protein